MENTWGNRSALRLRACASSGSPPASPRPESILGLQDKVAHLTHRTPSARGVGLPVGVVPGQWVGIGDGDRETDSVHDRQVNHIISHIGDPFIAQVQDRLEFFVGPQLIVLSLIDVRYPQLLHPSAHHFRGSTRDDGQGDTGLLQHLHAVTVPGVKRLIFLTVIAEEKAPVSQDPVNVEDH